MPADPDVSRPLGPWPLPDLTPRPGGAHLRDLGVVAVRLHRLALALRRPFTTAHGTTAERDVLLVEVVAHDGSGWGECSADRVPSYWWETVDTATAVLRDHLVPGPAAVVGHPMAKAALEMAVADLVLRRAGRSLAAALGGQPGSVVPATATVGGADDPAELVEAGYRWCKVKLDGTVPDQLPAPLAEAVAAGTVAVGADANGSLAATGDVARALDALGLAAVEQPWAGDLVAQAGWRSLVDTPVVLDESLASPGDVAVALALGSMDQACIKPSRLGGLGPAVAALERCAAAGVGAKVGGMLETGIGRAAALALASHRACTAPPDLSGSARYWVEDLTEPFVLDGSGRLTVPSGPGLGVAVDGDRIAGQAHATVVVDLRGA